MKPCTIEHVKGPFFNPRHSLHSLITGGINTRITFPDGSLTESERDYCRLVATSDFFQLVRTAFYMNEGLSFRDATIKYLKAKHNP